MADGCASPGRSPEPVSPARAARAEAAPLCPRLAELMLAEPPMAGSPRRNPTRGAGSSLCILGGWAVRSGVLSLAPCSILQRIREELSQTVWDNCKESLGAQLKSPQRCLEGRVMSTCKFCFSQNFVCIPMPYMSRICFQ